MNVYKCKICVDPYVGNTKPSNCPFCGAPAKFIILAENWVEPKTPDLSDASKDLLEESLKMEIDNVRFYRCATNSAKEPLPLEMFKALERIEAGHVSTARKLLGRPDEGIEDSLDPCSATSSEEHLREALQREREGVDFYRTAAESAQEEVVREFFTALAEVEEDHISLSNLGLGIA
jgi:rubrerythrin